MREKTDGYLTVEATLTLTMFLFFMMFIVMNMGQIYRAQNFVTHGLLQSGKVLSFNSFKYEDPTTGEVIVDVLESVLNEISTFWGADWFDSNVKDDIVKAYWVTGNYNGIVKEIFPDCTAGADTDAILKQYGLVNGVESIKFDTKKEGNDLVIGAEYDVQLPFRFFGFDHVTLHQQVKCGIWSTGDDD